MKKIYEKPKILEDEVEVTNLMAPGPSTQFIKCYDPKTCGGYTIAYKSACSGCTPGSWCITEKINKREEM